MRSPTRSTRAAAARRHAVDAEAALRGIEGPLPLAKARLPPRSAIVTLVPDRRNRMPSHVAPEVRGVIYPF